MNSETTPNPNLELPTVVHEWMISYGWLGQGTANAAH